MASLSYVTQLLGHLALNEIAHGAVKTNRSIYRGLYVALI